MWNKPLQGAMAKYVQEFYTGCKCNPRTSISPQLFYPKLTVPCGSGNAIDLGWFSFSVPVSKKVRSSKSYFVCFDQTLATTLPKWPDPDTGVSDLDCWLRCGDPGLGGSWGSPKVWHTLCEEVGCIGWEVGNVLLDESEIPLLCLTILSILNFNFWVLTLADEVMDGGCHVGSVAVPKKWKLTGSLQNTFVIKK